MYIVLVENKGPPLVLDVRKGDGGPESRVYLIMISCRMLILQSCQTNYNMDMHSTPYKNGSIWIDHWVKVEPITDVKRSRPNISNIYLKH